MFRNHSTISAYNQRIFYFTDILRALFFTTSIWVLFERQYLTMSQLTIVEATILGVTLVMQLPTGAFADMFGKKPALIIGCVLYFIALMLYSVSHTFHAFVIYAIVMGLGQSFIDGTREALLYDSLKEDNREHEFPLVASKLSMVFQVALATATLIGGLVGAFSYELAIRLTAFSFLGATVFCFFFREPSVDSEEFTLKKYIAKTKQGIRELSRTPYIQNISLYYIIIGSLTWVCALTFNMVLLTETGFTVTQIGIMVAAARILNSIALYRVIKNSSFLTPERTFLILPVVLIVTFIPTILFTGWAVFIPVLGAMLVSNARWNLLSRYTNAEFSSKNRATAISALCMIIGIVYVVVVGSSGMIIERFGTIRIMYTALGIIAAVTALPLGIRIVTTMRGDMAESAPAPRLAKDTVS